MVSRLVRTIRGATEGALSIVLFVLEVSLFLTRGRSPFAFPRALPWPRTFDLRATSGLPQGSALDDDCLRKARVSESAAVMVLANK